MREMTWGCPGDGPAEDILIADISNGLRKIDPMMLHEMQEAYLMAEAALETVKEVAAEAGAEILRENEFYESEENMKLDGRAERKRIMDYNDDWIMDKGDYERFLKLHYERLEAVGMADRRGWQYDPAADARKGLRLAEGALLDYLETLLPTGGARELIAYARKHWKYRKDLVKIMMSVPCGEFDAGKMMEKYSGGSDKKNMMPAGRAMETDVIL